MKFYAVFAALCAASIGTAQLLNEGWTGFANDGNSVWSSPHFIKNNQTIMLRSVWSGNTARAIVCKDQFGMTRWTYSLPLGAYPTNIRVTTDNFIYMTLTGAPMTVLAIDQDGGYRWQLTPSQYGYGFFSDNRIFGDSLLLAGQGRSLPLNSNLRTLLVSVNRFTGAVNYSREMLINNTVYTDPPAIRSAAGKAFLIMRRPSGTGILKVDPANGDTLATYAAGPVWVTSAEVDSASQVYFTGPINPTINTDLELRRIDGSGTGAMPMVYRKLTFANNIILSKGFIFSSANSHFLKIRPGDGATIVDKTPFGSYYGSMKADQYGRLYHLNPFVMYLLNPDTGDTIDSFPVDFPGYDNNHQGWNLSQYGEIISVGAYLDVHPWRDAFGVFAFSTQEPVNDVYSVAQGTTFVTNGNGLLANDRYSNPAAMTVTKVINSGPVKGKLLLTANGEFSYEAKSGGEQLPVGVQTFRYRSTRQGVVREGNVTLNITRGLTNFTVARPEIAGYSTVSGTVTLSSAGPATLVNLQDSSPLLSTPSSVTVLANKTSANFIMESVEVATPTPVTITATHESTTRTASLTIVPLAAAGITCSASVPGGQNGDLEVIINGRPGPGGFEVALSESSAYVTVPATVTIPPGATSVLAVANTTLPPSNQVVYIYATAGGVTKYCRMVVLK